MTVILATVGFTPAKVQPVIDRQDEKEELVLFHDREPKSKAAARELAGYAQKLGIPAQAVETDAFDLVKCCLQVRREIRKRAGRELLLSIAGGTRVLASAALLAGILEGVRVVHVHEKTGEPQDLPLLTLQVQDALHPRQRRVLLYVRDHPRCAQRDIAAALRLTKGTVSHHVAALKAQRLLAAEPAPDDARSERLSAVPSADLLLLE